MKKKNVILMIIITVLIGACMFGSYVVYRLFSAEVTFGVHGIYSVSLGLNETDDGWNLPVLSMTYKGEDVWKSQNVMYELVQIGVGELENGTLESIKATPSGYGVRWFDKDSDNRLSLGDVIFISKAGGPSGRVTDDSGFSFRITVPQQGEVGHAPLP